GANDMLGAGGSIALACERLQAARIHWGQTLSAYSQVSGSLPAGESFTALTDSLNAIVDCQQSMRGICQWKAARAQAEQAGLAEFAALIQAGLPDGDAVPLFTAAYARWFANWAIDDQPLLANFNASIHEETIVRFRQYTRK